MNIEVAATTFPGRPASPIRQSLPNSPRVAAASANGKKASIHSAILNQALLITSAAVGAGLLALPAATSSAGFVPSSVALVLIWGYMAGSALLLLEVAVWLVHFDPKRSARRRSSSGSNGGDINGDDDNGGKEGSRPINLLGMAHMLFGHLGRTACLFLYAMVYAATVTAYIAEGGKQGTHLYETLTACAASPGSLLRLDCSSYLSNGADNATMSTAVGQILFALGVGYVIYRGARHVERLNFYGMAGSMLAFVYLVRSALVMPAAGGGGSIGSSEAAAEGRGWSAVPASLPVLVVAFSYHNTVPSVFTSLHWEAKPSGLAVIIGSVASLFMYLVWQWVTLGGRGGETGASSGEVPPLTAEFIFTSLRAAAGLALPLFSFLALLTSLLSVGMGCVDFTEDALMGQQHARSSSPSSSTDQQRRARATCITFIPCLVIAVLFPHAFVPMLSFSGTFRQILFGALPVMMVWKGRKLHGRGVAKKSSDEEDVELIGEASKFDSPPILGRDSGQLLPGGAVGLFCMAAVTVLLIAIEVKHVVNSLFFGQH